MKWLKRGLFLSVLVAVWLVGWHFVDAHAAPIQLDFGAGRSVDLPLWQGLLAAAAVGGVTVGLPLFFLLIRSRLEGRHYRKQVGRLEDEVHGLRNLPLEENRKNPVEGSA